MQRISFLILLLFVLILYRCGKEKAPPNFLFITCEDISPFLSFHGDSTAKIPSLDRLASQSLIYKNAFATVAVCSPSRSSIITGMYPISIGTHNMRTGKDIYGWGQRSYTGDSVLSDPEGNAICDYSVVLPEHVKCFTQYLREHGYYCINNAKTDYQFAPPLSAWDENGRTAHYKNRKPDQPFFAVFNLEITHESRIWMKAKDSLRIDPKQVPLPSYYPDTKTTRTDVARNYSNIEELDVQVQQILTELEDIGLEDNTVVFFFSDHGGPLPRGKRAIFESGLHVPFLVKLNKKNRKGETDRLISFVDIAPTILSLAGIEPPDYMQGKAFLGDYEADEREYIFGSSDRFDECYDRIRCVRDTGYMLIRNYNTQIPHYLDVAYRKQIPMMREMLEMHRNDMLDSVQQQWFRTPKQELELYHISTDPEMVRNLAGIQGYEKIIERLDLQLDNWQENVRDLGEFSEGELLNDMWPELKQPQTPKPKIILSEDKFELICKESGADIVYRIENTDEAIKTYDNWNVYMGPKLVVKGKYLHVRACRSGYRDSEVVVFAM